MKYRSSPGSRAGPRSWMIWSLIFRVSGRMDFM